MRLPAWWTAVTSRTSTRAGRARGRALDDADRLAAGASSGDPALNSLLDALRAPATPAESSRDQAMIAALAAERRRTLSTRSPHPAPEKNPGAADPPARKRVRSRTVIASVAAAAALLAGSGTAVAARGGNLPAGVQQQAHRLFSGLGVPAPATGESPPASSPRSSAGSSPAPTPAVTPSPVTEPAAPGGSSPAGSSPAGTSTTGSGATTVAWCAAWQTAEDGGHPMNGRDRRDLTAAAGGAENVAAYCEAATTTATTTGTASAPTSAGPSSGTTATTEPGKATKSKKPKKSKEAKD
ncbi:hypothetical protein [Actinoplanes sp. NPDC023714]|uniref:hypothetical protein n=1 Tax=Actinoplanes sp. NPDC023714 TaxID=3154322 RepID=UPI0034116883